MTTPAHDLPRSYWRTTVAAAGAGLLTAFNTNKTSWVGLALFVAIWSLSSQGQRTVTPAVVYLLLGGAAAAGLYVTGV